TVTITAIQPRLRLSGTNRLGFQPSMAISDCSWCDEKVINGQLIFNSQQVWLLSILVKRLSPADFYRT
ncbi:MAG: hypothetical protein KZQ65_11500, partial [Candidatus Thiodiazotropha sp. (ex Gloverina cf. vestifex)]|nr:hypothetical protein [Candidatus Thiodiazotropha sp. (ex Gloverina cf. vestifex)]